MTERGMQLKSDGQKQAWEDSEFPVLCETCLGDNPYVRMMRTPHGKACKICERPFTSFRWKPGRKARFKDTQVCQTCAKLKNCCQTCILDLQYGLPIQVRDNFLATHEKVDMPKSDVNREYFTQNAIAKYGAEDEAGTSSLPYGKATHEGLMRLARKTPYYQRNLAHICSFFARGECTRGEECPYRHEMPLDPTGPLAKQNIKDRFYGTNDPVAAKILGKLSEKKELDIKPPADLSIKTVFVAGVDITVSEADLRDSFASFGTIISINMIHKSKIAFVDYESRSSAELAVAALHGNLVINGARLQVLWSKGDKELHVKRHEDKAPVSSTVEESEGAPYQMNLPPPTAIFGGQSYPEAPGHPHHHPHSYPPPSHESYPPHHHHAYPPPSNMPVYPPNHSSGPSYPSFPQGPIPNLNMRFPPPPRPFAPPPVVGGARPPIAYPSMDPRAMGSRIEK